MLAIFAALLVMPDSRVEAASTAVVWSLPAEQVDEVSTVQRGDLVVAWRSILLRQPVESSLEVEERSGAIAHPLDIYLPLAEATSVERLSWRLRRGTESLEGRWPVGQVPDLRPSLDPALAAQLAAEWAGDEVAPMSWVRVRDMWLQQPEHQLDGLWVTWRLALRARDHMDHGAAVAEWRRLGRHIDTSRPELGALVWRQLAWDLDSLGSYGEAEEAYEEAITRARVDHPGSLLLADALHLLASLRLRHGRSKQSMALLEEARKVRARLGPESEALCRTLNNLALAKADVGLAEEGETLLRRVLSIRLKHEPGTSQLAGVYSNLGGMAYQRGDLRASERALRRAKEIRQRLVPESLAYARVLNNLASVVETLGDLDKAELWYRESLELRRRLAPESPEVTSSLSNLATLSLTRGDFAVAVDFAEQALAHIEAVAAGSEFEAWSAKVLAHVLLETGRVEPAVAPARRSVDIYKRLVHGTVEMADAQAIYGRALLLSGRIEAAREPLSRALEIRQKIAPGSLWVAESQWLLGLLARRSGDSESARTLFEQSFKTFESLEGLGGETPHQRAEMVAIFVEAYREGVDFWAESGHGVEAFALLEKARAQGLSAVLAERSLPPVAEVPAAKLAERRRLAHAYESTRRQLASIDGADRSARDGVLRELNRLRDEREGLSRELRQQSPWLANVEAPPSLGWPEVAAAIDDESAVMAYSVGEQQTWLFVGVQEADGAHLQTVRLAVGRRELNKKVTALRLLLRVPSSSTLEIKKRAANLYRLLWAPAEPWVSGKQRILIVPDRALHQLPFAALIDREGRWLVERAALVSTLSASSAVASAQDQRQELAAEELLAFADPAGSQPLPWSRSEAVSIARVSKEGGMTAKVLIGEQATESRFKAEAGRASRLHIAAHANVDDLFPLDSHLRLAPSSGDFGAWEDGRVRVWEIFEQLRFNADLVTLSGCETGLGRELDGEGLNGLVRAFLFAGARNVLASQWRIEDRGTAALMTRFYDGLNTTEQAEALRKAQAELAAVPVSLPPVGRLARLARRFGLDWSAPADLRHPYYWAGFELTGEWR